MRSFVGIAILLFSGFNPAQAQSNEKAGPVKVAMAFSTPLKSGHAFRLLVGEPMQFASEQAYSKWSVAFDRAVRVESVEIETCPDVKQFEDGVELFLDFNQKRFFADGGRSKITFKVGATARTLTLGFLESRGLCLQNLQVKTAETWIKPRIMPLSRYEREKGEISLRWDDPLSLEGVRIWNGDQGLGDRFSQAPRVKDLELKFDGDRKVKTTLEDRRFDQLVTFESQMPSSSLNLKALTTYPGVNPKLKDRAPFGFAPGGSQAGAWSGIQLIANGETYFLVADDESPSARMTFDSQIIRDAGYSDIMDRELRRISTDEPDGDVWRFRLRSDGTFFARVFSDKARTTRAWSATGTWSLAEPQELMKKLKTKSLASAGDKKSAKKKSSPEELGLKIRLEGVEIASVETLDSIVCANRCFAPDEPRGPASRVDLTPPARERELDEEIEIQRDGRAIFFVRNRTKASKSNLDFRDLKVRLHSLYN